MKLEKKGDSIVGVLLGYEESKMYAGSYAISLRVDDEISVIFTNNIVVDMIKKNNLIGRDVKIVFNGKKKTQDGSKEYNDFEVFFR